MPLCLKFIYLELISHRLFIWEETLVENESKSFILHLRKLMVHHEDHKGELVTIPQVDPWSSALYIRTDPSLVTCPCEKILKTLNHDPQTPTSTQNVVWSFRDSLDCLEIYDPGSREASEPVLFTLATRSFSFFSLTDIRLSFVSFHMQPICLVHFLPSECLNLVSWRKCFITLFENPWSLPWETY